MKPHSSLAAPLALLALALTLTLAPAAASAARDPLQPPLAVVAAVDTAPSRPASAPDAERVRHIVHDGRSLWLVVGTRRLGAGDRWGALRIECIDERGVFARDEAGVRQHLPLFGAVALRPAAANASDSPSPHATPACPEPAASPTKRNPR